MSGGGGSHRTAFMAYKRMGTAFIIANLSPMAKTGETQGRERCGRSFR